MTTVSIAILFIISGVMLGIIIGAFVKEKNVHNSSHQFIDLKVVHLDDGTNRFVDAGTIFQFLESLNIIFSTSNMETLLSRMDYANNVYNNIKQAYSDDKPAYLVALSQAFQMFQKAYPGKSVPINMEKMIEMNEDEVQKFFSVHIVRCFYDFGCKMIQERDRLKTKSAQKRRMDKIEEYYDISRSRLQGIGSTDVLSALENIRLQLIN